MENNGKNSPLFFLGDRLQFPPVNEANVDGLLAVGGDLSPERLLLAYQSGIFPWFNEDDLILWWCPDPRMVLFPSKLRVSKSMQKIIDRKQFRLTKNSCFDRVVDLCAKQKRKDQEGTWITPKMKSAYHELFQKGFAKSYEVWQDDELVGGLYGIDLGHVFCGESMFSHVSNASKFAFIELVRELEEKNYQIVDCQLHTGHLESLGAEEIDRDRFMQLLKSE